ncbi:MAG: ABC transporter permease subunit [Spirochaetales bacterium]|nr:ABC transporter permease subunit [Spirochaetales bacterium]
MIILWKAASVYAGSSIILPSPKESVSALIAIITEEDTMGALASTLLRGAAGFLLAVATGLALGVPAGMYPSFRSGIEPLLVVVRSTPLISVILLALIWFSSGTVPVFVAFLMIFPIITSGVSEGISHVDQELLEMAEVYGMDRRTVIRWMYVPSVASYVFPGLETASGLAWKLVIAAEVLSRPVSGMGTKMQEARMYLETARLFAWTISALVISALFTMAVRFVFRRVIPAAGSDTGWTAPE